MSAGLLGRENKLSKINFFVVFIITFAVACGSNGNHNPGNCGGVGVPAAPNNALITATVLEVRPSSSNETILRLYITKSENIGTENNMAAADTEIEALARNQVLDAQVNDTITASASLVGDECGTVWIVTNVAKV